MSSKPQKYEIDGNTAILDISTPKYPNATALIDKDYLDKIITYGKWSLDYNGYAVTRHNKKIHKLHRVIMNVTNPVHVVDHINNIRFDNRKCNLRICTHHQNHMNHRKTRGTSKYKGVSLDKDRNKWYAEIRFNRKKKFLGRFESENEAGQAYNKAAKKLFGEYAYLNKIEE